MTSFITYLILPVFVKEFKSMMPKLISHCHLLKIYIVKKAKLCTDAVDSACLVSGLLEVKLRIAAILALPASTAMGWAPLLT